MAHALVRHPQLGFDTPCKPRLSERPRPRPRPRLSASRLASASLALALWNPVLQDSYTGRENSLMEAARKESIKQVTATSLCQSSKVRAGQTHKALFCLEDLPEGGSERQCGIHLMVAPQVLTCWLGVCPERGSSAEGCVQLGLTLGHRPGNGW